MEFGVFILAQQRGYHQTSQQVINNAVEQTVAAGLVQKSGEFAATTNLPPAKALHGFSVPPPRPVVDLWAPRGIALQRHLPSSPRTPCVATR